MFDTVTIDEATRYPGVSPPRTEPADGATPEQLDRRARSIARLRAEGVPVLSELPVIETESACRFRTRDEILDRALALLVVASRGAGDPEPYVDELAARFDTRSRYSPAEAAFMSSATSSAEDRATMSWRFESLLVLAWATVDAWVGRRPPPTGVSPDVIMEWHHAINWLIGYQGAAWDDVSTDT